MVKYVLFSLIATCFFLSCTLNTTANKSEATAPKCDSLLLNTEQMVNDTLWQFGSHCEIATCYEQGIGVEQNLNRAMHWYQESAKQGWPDAVTRLNQ